MSSSSAIKNKPGTIINWKDQSATPVVVENPIIKPLFLQLFTSDKGPENLREIEGKDFFYLYDGTPSFKKHGQPLLQAAEIIKAGGRLLCKRVVAPDAALANLIVVAKVSTEQVQKVNEMGKPLYIDSVTGKETTDSNSMKNERALINTAKIKYDAVSIKGAKSMAEVKLYGSKLIKDKLEAEAETGYDNVTRVGDPLTDENPVGQVKDTDDEDYGKYIYPLFVITDIGRGVSTKRFNIIPDYNISKNLSFNMYKLNFIGNTVDEREYVWFNFRDDVIYLDKNRSLDMIGNDLTQMDASSFDTSIDMFLNRISSITGIDRSELDSIDPIFGCNRKGEKLQQITIDEEGYDLTSSLGMMLQEGDNGSFGDYPINSASYAEEMVKVINGEFDDSIFDRDMYLIDVCCDANYPAEVKKALVDLAVFREDFVFLRDYGIGIDTFENIKNTHYDMDATKFVADYCQTWDVIDPWTKKQITVTATYSMAPKLVSHLVNNREAPICGILYNFVFPDVVEGTVNFLPKITPTVDQKALLSEIHVNYASIINNTLTMETCYTSQETPSQLSYINNIFAVTEVIHNIRTECPKIRYSFITDDDLEKYRSDVNDIIMRSRRNFSSIYMEYTQDEVMAANKIFEADIFVKFKNFEQQEIFNIYTLS